MAEQFAAKADLDNHVHGNPNDVHGILDRAKALIPTYVPLAPTLLTLTNDAAWHTVSLATYVPATVFMVKLQFVGVDGGRWAYFYVRANGSTEASGTARIEWAMHTPLDKDAFSMPMDVYMVDQTLGYKMSCEGADQVLIVGYWRKG